ncbi:hypothetical protein ABZW30_41020 [Kitasatospora sp. NPDC004669]|uniref:hypothetical protein n=1 Tax=Kitasatospora sp. NPDC004669 TaxID=3154555 RepID=UPI0033B416CB
MGTGGLGGQGRVELVQAAAVGVAQGEPLVVGALGVGGEGGQCPRTGGGDVGEQALVAEVAEEFLGPFVGGCVGEEAVSECRVGVGDARQPCGDGIEEAEQVPGGVIVRQGGGEQADGLVLAVAPEFGEPLGPARTADLVVALGDPAAGHGREGVGVLGQLPRAAVHGPDPGSELTAADGELGVPAGLGQHGDHIGRVWRLCPLQQVDGGGCADGWYRIRERRAQTAVDCSRVGVEPGQDGQRLRPHGGGGVGLETSGQLAQRRRHGRTGRPTGDAHHVPAYLRIVAQQVQ